MTDQGGRQFDVVPTEYDHVQGKPTAPVILLQYGDFECPYSQIAVETVRSLQRRFGPDLCYVFRHFPLEKHSHAIQASEAAEAAAAQGQFWPMYVTLFTNQSELEYESLLRYAGSLGLDRLSFAAALEDHRHLERIHADILSGRQARVFGTPTFFVSGIRQDGNDDVRALAAAIQRALNK